MELSELLGSDDKTSVVASEQADIQIISRMLSNRVRMRLLCLKNIISTSRLIFCIDFNIIKRFWQHFLIEILNPTMKAKKP